MALRHYIDGAEVVGKVRSTGDNAPGGGMAGLTSSADGGSMGGGGIEIDDVAGTLDLKGWRPYYAVEDTATPTRIFTGFLGGRTISQSDLYEAPGTARVWDCDLMDLNAVLGLRCFRSKKRPAETNLARIAWMLANWPAPDYPVYDNGGVGGSASNFDEADLDGEFPEQVLSAMQMDGRSFYVYWDAAVVGQERSLFWGPPTVARGDLATKLSNVPADINGTTVLAAMNGQQVSREPAFTYSGVYIRTKAGKLYRQNETTATTYIRRDLVYDSDRIGNSTTMSNRADQLLAKASTERDILTCTIQVENANVNLIREGYRVQVKFSHLPGYSSFTWVMVQRRTIRRPANGSIDWYELDLELSNFAPGGIGEGGDPGDFPHKVTPPSIVQQSAGRGNRTMPASITAGDTLVYVGSRRGGAFSTLGPLGYTEVRAQVVNGGGDGVGMFYKTAGASESTTLTMTGDGDIAGAWFELPGTWTPDTSASTTGSTVNLAVGPITVASNAVTFTIAGQGRGGAYDSVAASLTFTPGSGWTEDLDTSVVAGHPSVFAAHRFDSGSLTGNATNSGNGGLSGTDYDWGMQIASFVGAVANEPPSPGQEVPWAVVTMAGAVGTTAYPYADGSLLVKVDGLLISRASYTETNPAAGTFTLSWTPDTSEVVTAQYIGR